MITRAIMSSFALSRPALLLLSHYVPSGHIGSGSLLLTLMLTHVIDLVCAGTGSWAKQTAQCRVDIDRSLDLQRYHTGSLAECISKCEADTACKAITFAYPKLEGREWWYDNCWLKAGKSPTAGTLEDRGFVKVVSVMKPEPSFDCFHDVGCQVAVGTAIMSFVFSLFTLIMTGAVGALFKHIKDGNFTCCACSRRSSTP